MLVVVAGGPAATLCLFILAGGLLAEWGPFSPAAAILSYLAQVNFVLFVMGLIPNGADSSVRNDARLLLTLLANGNEAEQIKLYHQVTRLQIAGVRPSAYPGDLVLRLSKARGNSDLMLFSALSMYLWALDSGEIAIAASWEQYANALLETRSLRLANMVLVESACFDLLYRNSPHSAIGKLKAAKIAALSPWLRERAEATLAAAECRWPDAMAALQRARASFLTSSSYFEFESGLLELIESRAMITNSRALGALAGA